MKFWQLVSLLRGHKDALNETFELPKWSKYATWHQNWEAIVEGQDRAKLDALLPDQLVIEALAKTDIHVYRSADKLCSTRRSDADTALCASDAFELYGGAALEDVFERGSVKV